MFGTMIEMPRAALTAGEIAEYAEFFSFGTNDLTQMTYGYLAVTTPKASSCSQYVERGILPDNPFQTLDQVGVGRLVEMCVEDGQGCESRTRDRHLRRARWRSRSIDFCHRAGLDYVSCSPFRVPVARLAAAQATIRNSRVLCEA